VLARFIKGAKVDAVWCEFYDERNEKWNRTRLLLSTNSELSAEEIIVAYAKRWSIESTFHELKNAWGSKISLATDTADIKSLGTVNDNKLRINSIVVVDASRKTGWCHVAVTLAQ
jgi:hypothetical protein